MVKKQEDNEMKLIMFGSIAIIMFSNYLFAMEAEKSEMSLMDMRKLKSRVGNEQPEKQPQSGQEELQTMRIAAACERFCNHQDWAEGCCDLFIRAPLCCCPCGMIGLFLQLLTNYEMKTIEEMKKKSEDHYWPSE